MKPNKTNLMKKKINKTKQTNEKKKKKKIKPYNYL